MFRDKACLVSKHCDDYFIAAVIYSKKKLCQERASWQSLEVGMKKKEN